MPRGVPKFVVHYVCRLFLKYVSLVQKQKRSRIIIQHADLNGVYKDYNIEEATAKQISDLDETRDSSTPLTVLRSKISPERIHYPRLGPDPVYKRKSG